MAIVLDAIYEIRPGRDWESSHALVTDWLCSQDRSAADRKESTSELVYYLNTLADRHGDFTGARIVIREINGVLKMRTNARDLLTDFRLLARHLGLRCPWQNERQLGLRIADAEPLLESAGWTKRVTISSGKKWMTLRRRKYV
jgi:hypothetical protein